jgi:hypothetical protein
MALWGELGSKLATTRSPREAFDPWSFGLAGNVASISSIDVQREALSLSAPTKCRAARRIALKQTGTSRCRFSRVLKREKRLARESRGRLGIFGPSRARQTGVGFRRRAAKRNVPKFLELNGSVDALGRPNNTLSQSGSRCCHRAAIIRRVR